MNDKRRLIEVAFPLKQASLASVHEKDVRHGHISTLHVWPARRPLAASRAALLATFLPDLEDPTKRQELLDRIGGTVTKKHVKEVDENGKTTVEDKEIVEGGVLAWGQENDPEMDRLRDSIRTFYGGRVPKVLDPFAGGGAIPLEAMRLGCDVQASDLNPVAWLILKCTLDYPQRFVGKKWPLPDFVREWPDFVEDYLAGKIKKRKGRKKAHFSDALQLRLAELPPADLAWHVRAWGRWVLEKTRAELTSLYPIVNAEPTVAYLWAKTARDRVTAGKIPLLKTFWLCKKPGRRTALLPIPRENGAEIEFQILRDSDIENPGRTISEYPCLGAWEVTPTTLLQFLDGGTMNRAGVWSPVSGRPGIIALTMDDLKKQGKQGLLASKMTAVVVEVRQTGSKKTRKDYRLPTANELEAAEIEPESLGSAFAEIPFGIPHEPIVEDSKRNTWCVSYGVDEWHKVFTSRQLLALATFVKHIRSAIGLIQKDDQAAAEAIGAFLAVTLDRVADRGSNVCTWTVNWDKIRNTFARFAMAMAWDFVECVPIFEASGGYPGQLEFVAQYVDHALALNPCSPVHIAQKSATSQYISGVDVIVTDPPYYDAIGYSVLMDFFYVWLRRTLHGTGSAVFDEVFAEPTAPKWDTAANDGELVDDAKRFGNDKARSI